MILTVWTPSSTPTVSARGERGFSRGADLTAALEPGDGDVVDALEAGLRAERGHEVVAADVADCTEAVLIPRLTTDPSITATTTC